MTGLCTCRCYYTELRLILAACLVANHHHTDTFVKSRTVELVLALSAVTYR